MNKRIIKKLKIFGHNLRNFKRKIKSNSSLKYRIRYIIVATFIFVLIAISASLLVSSFAKYESKANIALNMDAAMYIVEAGNYSFDLNLDGIVPQSTPYIYAFTISNYKGNSITDTDLAYTIRLETTTNMPLSYNLYKDEEYQNGTNILTINNEIQDSEGTWYKVLSNNETYTFSHGVKTTNTYTLAVYFPEAYKYNSKYTNRIEHVEVIVESKQIVKE